MKYFRVLPNRFPIQTKLILTVLPLFLTLIPLLSYIYIKNQENNLQEEMESRVRIIKGNLQRRGIALARTLALASENAIAGFDLTFLSDLIRAAAEGSPGISFILIMDNSRQVLVHTDVNQVNQILNEPVDIEASQIKDVTIYEYQRQGQDIMEVSVPIQSEGERLGTLRIGFDLETSYSQIKEVKERLSHKLEATWKTAGIITGIFLIMGSIILSLISKRITTPIQKLVHSVHLISGGDLTQKVDIKSRDEIGELAEAFNQMTSRLRQSYEQLEEYSRTLEQKVAERTRELEELYRFNESIIRNAPIGISTVNDQGIVTSQNPAWAEIMGFKGSETAVGMKVVEIPTIRDTGLLHVFKDALEKGIPFKGFNIPYTSYLTGKEVLLNVVLTPILGEDGQVKTLLCLIQDNTEKARAEEELKKAYEELKKAHQDLQNAQLQLVQSEKLASLGQLVAGVAHEINNPVNFISSGLTPLRRNIDDLISLVRKYSELSSIKPDQLENFVRDVEAFKKEIEYEDAINGIYNMLESIREGVQRTVRIVRDLRSFSRPDEAELKEVNLHEGLESTLNLLSNPYKNRIEVIREYGDIPPVECYAGQINQVFMNLLVNASQAIKNTGQVRIKTWRVEDKVKISIKDSGSGIPQEILGKIFDPFFTTKQVGEGTGLGLSISYGIIQKHHGKIEVQSEVGVGSEFIITLPIKQSR
ncbi:MAG TPA: ATP-binding protein [Candidatus Limnocylindrales bacterium]|nr:ATP-binding protein [Candidatus Limnocylindrales bacterium]